MNNFFIYKAIGLETWNFCEINAFTIGFLNSISENATFLVRNIKKRDYKTKKT